MIKEVKVYRTSDGQYFTDEVEAEKHESSIGLKGRVRDFLILQDSLDGIEDSIITKIAGALTNNIEEIREIICE